MKTRTFFFTVAAAALTYLLAFSSTAFAAKGGIPGPPTNGGEEAGNNLSLPAVLTGEVNSIEANWFPPAEPELGVHYSYGCDRPETDGHFSYPNTSCVNNLMSPTDYYTAAVCIDPGHPCDGFALEDISRIYWQKVDANNWWADEDGISPNFMEVAFVDWGDALEAVSWNTRSKIRVETQPYSSLFPEFISGEGQVGPCFDTADSAGHNPNNVCRVGFQMWHVSGQGITEHWGVRATEEGVSYNYDSPFQIINTSTARLNLAKMSPNSAECPSPGGGEEEGEAVILAEYEIPDVGAWNGSDWNDACTWRDASYSVELSVGGKYVYGYNWDMKTVNLEACPSGEWTKTGWWRLTFYTTDGAVDFVNSGNAPTSAPPAVPAEVRDLVPFTFNTASGTYVPAAGELYIPVVDAANNLTYLDICIVAKDQGGGGGGGGGNRPQAAGGGPGGGTGGGGAGKGR